MPAEVCSSPAPEVSAWACCLLEALSACLLHVLLAWWVCSVALWDFWRQAGICKLTPDLLNSMLMFQNFSFGDDVIARQNRLFPITSGLDPFSLSRTSCLVCPGLMLSGL